MTNQAEEQNEASMEEILASIRKIIADETSKRAPGVDQEQSNQQENVENRSAPEDFFENINASSSAPTINTIESGSPQTQNDTIGDDILDLTNLINDAATSNMIAPHDSNNKNDTGKSEAMTEQQQAAMSVDDIDALFDTPAPAAQQEAPAANLAPDDIDALFDTPAPAAQQEAPAPLGTDDIDALFAKEAAPNPVVVEDIIETKIVETVPEKVATENIENLISKTAASETFNAFAALSNITSSLSSQMHSGNDQQGSIGNLTLEQIVRHMLRPMLKEWLDSHLPSLVKWLVTEQIEKLIQQQMKDKS